MRTLLIVAVFILLAFAGISFAAPATGFLDLADGTAIAGWAQDPDFSGPIMVHIYVDGQFTQRILANANRPDVGAHAFHWVHKPFGAGDHEVRAYAIGVNSAGTPDGNPELGGSPKIFNVGCQGLTESELVWCQGVPSYWADRQRNTVVLANEFIRIGMDKSRGGTITQLYDQGWTNNLIEQHGGAMMQISIWGYDVNGGLGAWFANFVPGQCDATPYTTKAACEAVHGVNGCVERGAAHGAHVAVCGTDFSICNNDAGMPFNPIQAQGPSCFWAPTTLTTSTGNSQSWFMQQDNPYHFTKTSTQGFQGMRFRENITLGDAYAKIDYQISYNGAFTLGDHPQEIPAIFTSPGISAREYYYNGNSPYTDINSPVTQRVVTTENVFIAFSDNLPAPFGWNLVDNMTEKWWSICDSAETRCMTVATFDPLVKGASLTKGTDGGTAGYITPLGNFAMFPGADYKVTLYVFPYKYNALVNGKTIRQRIFELRGTVNRLPIGFLDGVANGQIAGWSFDQDHTSDSNPVHIYIDGQFFATTANTSRPDVNAVFGITGNHGYVFSIPNQFRDGQLHTLNVYGLDLDDGYALLSGSPMNFTISTTLPIVNFSVSPSSVWQGAGAVLSWTTNFVSGVSIDNGIGFVAANGTRIITPVANTTYTLTATGPGGITTRQATVIVTPMPPTVAFSSNPPAITVGEFSTLQWTTTRATTVSIDNGIGAVAQNGTINVTPATTTTYTISATNAGGTTTIPLTVTVEPVTPPFYPVINFSASQTSIVRGQQTTLSWTTTNATSVQLSTIGTVVSAGSINVSPASRTNYTLTATNAAGTSKKSVVINVAPNTLEATLTASPASIMPGASSRLSWSVKNADNISIDNGIGPVAANGSMDVRPISTTTYTLTASNAGGSIKQATVVIIILSGEIFANFTASASIIRPGDSVILAWETTSDKVYLDGSAVNQRGTMTVVPKETHTYQLDVYNKTEKKTYTQTVTVVSPSSPGGGGTRTPTTPKPPPIAPTPTPTTPTPTPEPETPAVNITQIKQEITRIVTVQKIFDRIDNITLLDPGPRSTIKFNTVIGTKRGKFLGLLPVDVKTYVYLDANNKIVNIVRPFWAFLVF